MNQPPSIKDLQVFDNTLYSLRSIEGKIHPYTHMKIHIGEHSVHSKILEFGGNSFFVHKKTLYYINSADQNLYSILPHTTPKLVLHLKEMRLGDFSVGNDVVYCIAEEKEKEKTSHAICAINLKTTTLHIIHSSYDFYGYPRLSHDQTTLCWIAWNHPHMPWDETIFMKGHLNTPFTCSNPQIILHEKNTSIMEPLWLKDGRVIYFSDKSGYWNPYIFEGTTSSLCKEKGDFSYPLWQLGIHRNTIIYNNKTPHLFSIVTKNSVDYLHGYDLDHKNSYYLDLSQTTLHSLTSDSSQLYVVGSSFEEPEKLLTINPFKTPNINSKNPQNEVFTFPRSNGTHGYGWLYLPPNTKPPLIIRCHGGPTAHASNKYNPEIKHWIDQGFAFLDLNYAGSTGFGKKYRELLNGKWGTLDVEDVINAAHHLIKTHMVNPNQLFLKGSSAGGFTVLSTICKTDMFSAASCYYGISDLCALAEHTHKFEIYYLNKLIGPYPEEKTTYIERSPLSNANKIMTPTIFFQGDSDNVVLPSQTHNMYSSLKNRNIETQYHLLKNEGHGIRQPENIQFCATKELDFFTTNRN